MDFEDINLPVGSGIQIQATVPEKSPRFSVRVLGYLPGASLIVTTPTANGKVLIVREGQAYTVRMLQGDSVVGFVTRVLHNSHKPYPHMHLEFPKEIDQIRVRNAVRVGTDVPATIRNTKTPDATENYHPGRIIDLSESGARISLARSIAEVSDMVQLGFELDVLGQSEQLALVADVRNVNERITDTEDGKVREYMLGVQFRAVNRFQQVLLHAWVMHSINQNTKKK